MTISTKAMQGRNGFLFLNGKDSNNLVEHLQGRIDVKPSALQVHRLNRDVIEQLGLPFLGIIVPEAHCLYPEELPSDIAPPVEARPVHRVLPEMAPGYVYALDLLRDYKAGGGTVYTGRDSHWTQPAALYAYRALRGRLKRSHDFELGYEPREDAEVGDLAMGDRDHVVAAERRHRNQIGSASRKLFASSILNHGNVMVLHNPRGQGRCLAFGTSFSNRLVPAYASDFREVVFCYGTTVDPFMVDLVAPDCVISELPERFLHFPAVSARGSTLLAMILGLTEQGATATPPVHAAGAVPPELADLIRLLTAAAAMAAGGPARSLLRLVEPLDPDLALRLALLQPHLATGSETSALRLLLSGQYYNPLVLRRVAKMIDSGRLGIPDLPLLPQSENARLAAIRIFLRADLPGHARRIVDEVLDRFGASVEATYYRNHLAP